MDTEGKTRTPMEWSLLNRSKSWGSQFWPDSCSLSSMAVAPTSSSDVSICSAICLRAPEGVLMAGVSWRDGGTSQGFLFANYGNSEVISQMVPFRQVYVNMCTLHYQYVYVNIYIYYSIYIYTWSIYKQITSPYLQFGRYLLRQSIQDGTTIPAMWRQLLFTVRSGFLCLAILTQARSSWRIWINA